MARISTFFPNSLDLGKPRCHLVEASGVQSHIIVISKTRCRSEFIIHVSSELITPARRGSFVEKAVKVVDEMIANQPNSMEAASFN